ncbi:hypothetical protein SBV1_1700010 [Verrucomicrobia bacterium]|nr:hypothetical protein SBV1_1700010 [Verrucomicrobiota bacterium]
MSADQVPERPALRTAEEILRTIYGDDLKGCTVSLETIAALIDKSSGQALPRELLDLYEKVVEAVHLLSTPPKPEKLTTPEELRTLLGERLDAIHTLTTRTMGTLARVKAQQGGNQPV